VKRVALLLVLGLVGCGQTIEPGGTFDASHNPAMNDAGNVLEPDASIPGVSRNGWTWDNVGPQAADLYGVWGSGPSDVWFVGAAATILHWDGHTFTAPDSGTSCELRGIWGSGPSDVWVVGRTYFAEGPAVILHWDGTAWATVETLPASDLYAVSGTGPTDVWAVGGKGLVVHWDGTAWTQSVLGNVDAGTPNDLDAVWTGAPGDVWAAGSITPVAYESTLFHRTGGTWSSVTPPDNGRAELASVWGSSPTDVWFAGQSQVDPAAPRVDPSGYLIHWDGTNWGTPFIVPTFSTPLGSVFGSSATDVHAAGWGVALSLSGSWSVEALPGDYDATWESGPSDVWAVGLGGVMAHWDGTAWTQLTPPPPARGIYTAAAIWADTTNDAWIAGNGPLGADLERWNGTAWVTSTLSSASPAYLYFVNIWGTGPSDVWGVGTGAEDTSGRIIHYDGTSWTDMYDAPSNYGFSGVWGSSASDVWFAGGNSTLVHWDGQQMTPTSFGTSDGFEAVAGSSATDVWVAGNLDSSLSSMHHWDGSTWSSVTIPSDIGFITSLYVASSSDIWGVGWEGGAAHWDGSSWAAPTTPLPQEVGSVWGSSGSDIWAVGWFGAVLHYDGSAWTLVSLTESDLAGVSGTSATNVWMVTSAGAILHHP
jgi:hypothetical protein